MTKISFINIITLLSILTILTLLSFFFLNKTSSKEEIRKEQVVQTFPYKELSPMFMEIRSMRKDLNKCKIDCKKISSDLNKKIIKYNEIANQFSEENAMEYALPNNIKI